MKDQFRHYIFAATTVLLSILPFLTAVDLAVWMVKMFRGLASFGALFALIPLAIVELSFVILVGPYYRQVRGRHRVLKRFLSVAAIELGLVFLFEAVRFLTLRLSSGITLSIYGEVRPPLYTVIALVALGAGVLLLGASFFFSHQRSDGKKG